MPEVLVPAERLARWVDNFSARHPEATISVSREVRGQASDGARFVAHLPFGRSHTGAEDLTSFVQSAEPPHDWGVLLVRKGGFAVARLSGRAVASSKVGQRHVQGRTKAGGQSQQRFARRRDNQAHGAWQAAAAYAVEHLTKVTGPVMVSGDRQGIDEVLTDSRLRHLDIRHLPLTQTPGAPRRAALEQAVADALALRIDVHNG